MPTTDWEWTRSRVVAAYTAELAHLDELAARYMADSRTEITIVDAEGTVVSRVLE